MQPIKNRRLFLQAMLFSIALHLSVGFWLDGVLVSPTSPNETKAPLLSSSLQQLKEREIKNQALKTAFSEIRTPPLPSNPEKTRSEYFAYALTAPLAKTSLESPLLSLQVSLPFPVNQFSLPPVAFSSGLDLPRDIPLPELKSLTPAASVPIELPIHFVEPSLIPVEPVHIALDIPEIAVETTPAALQAPTKRSFSLPPLPPFSQLPILSKSDWFDAELLFLPVEGEEGAQFAITLVPSNQLQAPKLPQDFIFLIDRSNSIQKDRLFATKQALARALRELNPSDRFNIIAFDSKVDKLFPIPKNPDKETLEEATNFLNSIELGSFFSPSDLYRPLLFSLPSTNDDHLTHIVLMSDGEALQKKTIQQALIQDWTKRNRGKASLYAIGLESDPHIQSMDALCALNRGKLFTAPTSRVIRKRLFKLIQTMGHPIANEVSVTAINKRTGSSIPLNSQSHSCLFLGQPAVFLGSMEKMDDFILFIQAKVDEQWVQVKKTLSFLHAKRGGRTLRMEIALQKAYEAYLMYSEDNDTKHLAEARSILEPFDLLPAFQ